MRPFLSTGFFVFILALAGCSASHGGDPDGGGGGDGGSGSDGAFADAGSGGSGGGSGGSGGGSGGSGGGSGGGGGTDAGSGGSGIDLIESCVAVCDHLVSCYPMFDRIECVAGCLDSREWLSSPGCEALTVDLFECVLTLECAELMDADLSGSVCAPIIRVLERDCSVETRPSDPPPVEPAPAG